MIDFAKLEEEQRKLAKKVIISDYFDKLELIGGVHAAYQQDDIVSAIVVCDYKTMDVKERVFAIAKARIPYVPGFLAFREGPSISEAYAKLEIKPDILIFGGNGILHPRRCGLASHMGVLLDQSAIGVAKQLFIGDEKGSVIYVGKEARAGLVLTREYSKAVYVSPGHKISLKSSIEIVKNCTRFPHKLPEPLHLAHKLAKEIMERTLKGEIKLNIN